MYQVKGLWGAIVGGWLVSLLLCASIGTWLCYQYWDRYQNRTIRHVQSVEINISAHSLPLTLAHLLQHGSQAEIQAVMDSAYALIGFFITDCQQAEGPCDQERIVYRSQSKAWAKQLQVADLADSLYTPIAQDATSPRFRYAHAYEKQVDLSGFVPKTPILGRLYLVRSQTAPFVDDFARFLQGKAQSSSGRTDTYVALLSTMAVIFLLASLLWTNHIRRKREQALRLQAEQDEHRVQLAHYQRIEQDLRHELIQKQQQAEAEHQQLQQQLSHSNASKEEIELQLNSQQQQAQAEQQRLQQELETHRQHIAEQQQRLEMQDNKALPSIHHLERDTSQYLSATELREKLGLSPLLANPELIEVLYSDRYLHPKGAEFLADLLHLPQSIELKLIQINTREKVISRIKLPEKNDDLTTLSYKQRKQHIEKAFQHFKPTQVRLHLAEHTHHMRYLEFRTQQGKVARAYFDNGMGFIQRQKQGYQIRETTYVAVDPWS